MTMNKQTARDDAPRTSAASEPHARSGARGPRERMCRGVRRGEAPRQIRTLAVCAAIVLMVAGYADRPAANGDSTKLLRMPTVSATHIGFAYANNIWTVERGGGMARRLTSFQGQTTNPHFSPDGKWIAFSGEYAGNVDVYVVPAEGGEPKRLTWHPGADSVQGWMPDGKSIVFASTPATPAPTRAPRSWTLSPHSGGEEPMSLPRA